MVDTPRFTDAYLDAVLDAWGLAVEYTSASEHTVFTADGTAISDFIGGYGSTLLGHNHPEIVAHVRKLLDDGVPVHAQMSRRPDADRVGALLNRIVQRELGGDERYRVVFGNTGAEAVEIAMKHAVLDRAQRLAVLTDDLDRGFATVRAVVTAGAATVPPIVYALLELPPDSGIDAVIAEVTRRNAEILAEPPVFLALEKGFHGKLTGSVQLTHNPGFRAPFAGLGPRVRFVPPEDADALTRAFDELRGTVLDLVVTDGVVELADHDFPVVAGMLVEPVQGEGGVNPLTPEYAGLVRALTEERHVPLIVDEIQSGCGRTGAFFASGRLGLRGDYITLAKSLGGGVAKLSVLLVRESRYRPEFELVHSSTFAQDGLTTSVAVKVLEIMEAGDGFYRRVAERGERLRHALAEVAAEFPDVVREVRGVGLLAGFEFHDQSRSGSPLIAGWAAAGVLGYVVSGYLLRAHRLRLAPTASATNTLRIQPPVTLSDKEIDRLAAGLRDVSLLLRNQDAAPLVHLDGSSTVDHRARHRPTASPVPGDGGTKVALVAGLGPAALRDFDPSLAGVDSATLTEFVRRNRFIATLAPLPPIVITGPHGPIEVTVHPVLVSDDSADALAPQVAAVIQAASSTADAVAVDTALSGFVAGVPADARIVLGSPDDEPYRVPEGLPPGFGAAGQVPAVVIESSTVPVRA